MAIVLRRASDSHPGGRFGIGEWYGFSFLDLTEERRRRFAEIQLGKREDIPCPAQTRPGRTVLCKKRGGVCTLRLYQKHPETGLAKPVAGNAGRLRTVCPSRFEETGLIYRWVAATILSDAQPHVLSQIGFLDRLPGQEHGDAVRRGVGRIDNVLVSCPSDGTFVWCALEKQAVYFQGDTMGKEWRAIHQHEGNDAPFPAGTRRPDYRSSGPKRLMPQLQIKVPTLRRWGKKMAVVVDEDFFDSFGRMEEVDNVSNCDIAWFVVGYGENNRLCERRLCLTTLERSVEGLTAGRPVTLETFEARIREKLRESAS